MSFSWRFRRRATTAAEQMEDYVDVLVPLEQAHLHSHSARTGKTEFETLGDDSGGLDREEEERAMRSSKDGGDSERQGMLQMKAAEYTIEGLRKETREGRGGNWTTYESE